MRDLSWVMWIACLLSSYALGIAWADWRGATASMVSPGARIAADGVAASLLLLLFLYRVRTARGRGLLSLVGWRRPASAGALVHGLSFDLGFALVVSAFALAVVLAFWTGGSQLAQRVDSARRDHEAAVRIEPGGIRIIEADVLARRPGRFGDTIELGRVEAVGLGAEPRDLPDALLLRRDTERPGAGPASLSTREAPTQRRALTVGDRVRLGVRVRPLRARRNPGASDSERREARRGFAAGARLVDDAWILGIDETSWTSEVEERLVAARTKFRDRIGRRFARAGDDSGLARALVLGDRRSMPSAVVAGFRKLGLGHLLAISGLHVGLVAGFAAWLVRRAVPIRVGGGLRPFGRAAGAAVFAAAAYAWLASGGAATLRAASAVTVVAALTGLGRSVSPMGLLAFVALGMLWADPAMLFDFGAQLSFAACLGIVVAAVGRDAGAGVDSQARSAMGEPRDRLLEQVLEAAGLSLRVSFAAGLATAPVLVWHDMAPGTLGPALNLFCVPLTACLVLPVSLCAAMLAGIAPVSDSAGGVFEFLTHLLLRPIDVFATGVVFASESLPVAEEAGFGSPVAVGCVALLGLACLRRRRIVAVTGLWLMLCVFAVDSPLRRGTGSAAPRVWFFDVGQGDASLISSSRARVLVDTGGGPIDGMGGHALLRTLRSLGVRNLDVMIVTHADLDHRGGALRILNALTVRELWLPDSGREDSDLVELAAQARARGTETRWLHAESRARRFGELSLEVLWPPADAESLSRNGGSLVVRAELEGRSILYMADVDASVETRLAKRSPSRIDADYLKVSHHGSRSGTPQGFLRAVNSQYAIVSAPCAATRGLPNRETLGRIEDSGSELLWTGRDGAIAIDLRSEHRGGNVRRRSLRRKRGNHGRIHTWAQERNCSGEFKRGDGVDVIGPD